LAGASRGIPRLARPGQLPRARPAAHPTVQSDPAPARPARV